MKRIREKMTALLLLMAFCAITATALTENPSRRLLQQPSKSPLAGLFRTPAQKTHTAATLRKAPIKHAPAARKFLASEVSYYESMAQVELSDPIVYTNVASDICANGSGALVGDTYYCVEHVGGSVFTISAYDDQTWEQKSSTIVYGYNFFAHDMTYDPVDKKIYGNFMNVDDEGESQGFVWGWLDVENLRREAIAEMDRSLAVVAATPEGVIYAIDYEGELFTVNKATGALTHVADTGLKSELATGGVIDPKTGTFYYITQNNTDKPVIYTVDTSTGASQAVGTLDEYQQLRGMFFPRPLASDNAPAAVTDINPMFSGNALMGMAVITMPNKTYAGDDMFGQLSYTVYINGEQYSTGTSYCGDMQYEFIEFPAPGMYTIGVTVSNENGTSPMYEIERWIGLDELQPLRRVTMTEEEGNVQLSWAEATSVHGGWFDPELVSYDVTRLPDETAVATDLKATQCTDVVEKGELIKTTSWRVDMKYDGQVLSSATSAPVVSGTQTEVPFRTSFESEADFSFFSVIDANADGSKWKYLDFYDLNQCAGLKAHDTNAGNDYLVTPGIRMKGGQKYKFSFTPACYMEWCPERLEVLWGTAPTVEALTGTLVEPMTVNKDKASADRMTVIFTPEEDGVYYFAFHGISDPYMYYLLVDDISVTGTDGTAPAKVTDMKVTPGAQGASSATVEFVAPAITENGEPLSSLDRVTLKRNGTTVKMWENPAPGEALSYEDVDTMLAGGTVTYSAFAENAGGEGAPVSASVYVGEDIPGKVRNLKARENPDGTVTVTWDCPEKGENGGYVNPDNVTYKVSRLYFADGTLKSVATTTETSYADTFEAPEQTVLSYTVQATNLYGQGRWADTESLVLGGTPYELPFVESAKGGYAAYPLWGSENMGTKGSWFLAIRGVAPVCEPQDADGGMFEFVPEAVGDKSRLTSCSIDASACKRPVLTFWYYAAGTNVLSVEVNADNSGWQSLETYDLSAKPEGWTRARVDLSGCGATTSFRLGFTGEAREVPNGIYIDNIRLDEAPAVNLGIASAVFTDEVVTGFPVQADITVENSGLEAVSGARLELLRNGDVAASYDIPALQPGQTAEIHAEELVTPSFPEHLTYAATIVLPTDEDVSDNSEACNVTIRHNYDLPVPGTPVARNDNNDVTLTWSAPAEYSGSLETFEAYEPFGFLNTIGPWTSIDGNGSGKITPIDAENAVDYPTVGLAVGFQVFDAAQLGLSTRDLDGRDGSRALIAFADKQGANNDWLISPQVKGGTEVSFYVKAGSPYFTENFEVLSSSTDRERGSFTEIGEVRTVGSDWTKVSVTLPADARYFAIRYCSFDCYALMLDDISYTTEAGSAALTGYNVYRDGQAAGTATLAKREFTQYIDATCEYAVTALYDRGESLYSQIVRVESTGIESVNAGDITLRAADGTLTVTGAEGLIMEVVDMQGVVVDRRECSAREELRLPAGVYAVRIGTRSWKVRL